MRIRIATVISVAVLGLAVPGIASAHRRATNAEKSAMTYGAGARYYGGMPVAEPRSIPQRCFVADIATVVRGSRWGAWGFSSYAAQPAHEQQCQVANGLTIEHKIGNRWYVLWQGSEGYPPTRNTRDGSLLLRAVPRRVAKDLIAGL